MNTKNTWWTDVDSSVKLIDEITEALYNEKNVVVTSETELPWKEFFSSAVSRAVAGITGNRKVITLKDKNAEDVGEYLCEKVCGPEISSKHWWNESYAEFLAPLEGSGLNSKIIIISGIKSEVQAQKWISFINEYYSECLEVRKEKLFEENRTDVYKFALFILEYEGASYIKLSSDSFSSINYSITTFDRYMFCLSALSRNELSFEEKQYIADLVCNLSCGDMEFCASIIDSAKELVNSPCATFKRVSSMKKSDGSRFSISLTEEEIKSCVLMAQIKNVLPAIEKFRMDFLQKHSKEFLNFLPFKTGFDVDITDPFDLELAHIYCIMSTNHNFGTQIYEEVKQYRYYRNELAHNHILEWDDVANILNER